MTNPDESAAKKPRLKAPKAVINIIHKLISEGVIQSVSCPFDDASVWRILVAEQVRRSRISGLPPQEAFTLCGPDGGLPFSPEDWGGSIHTPSDGVCGSDLFIIPRWMRLRPEAAMGKEGALRKMVWGRQCHYILTDRDYGELDAAICEVHDGWYLYRSRLPYIRSRPIEH